MNPQTLEKPGPTKDLSCKNSGGALFGKTFVYVLTRPACLLFYWLSWHHLCDLCWYGRLYRNLPALAVCLLWWLGAIGYGLWLWSRYRKGRCPHIYRVTLSLEKGLVLSAEAEGRGSPEARAMSEDTVKWYVKKGQYCQLFTKKKEVLLLDLQGMSEEEKDFLKLNLSAVEFSGNGIWRAAAGIFLVIVTLRGAELAVKSAIPFRGKLSWYVYDWMRDVY